MNINPLTRAVGASLPDIEESKACNELVETMQAAQMEEAQLRDAFREKIANMIELFDQDRLAGVVMVTYDPETATFSKELYGDPQVIDHIAAEIVLEAKGKTIEQLREAAQQQAGSESESGLILPPSGEERAAALIVP